MKQGQLHFLLIHEGLLPKVLWWKGVEWELSSGFLRADLYLNLLDCSTITYQNKRHVTVSLIIHLKAAKAMKKLG